MGLLLLMIGFIRLSESLFLTSLSHVCRLREDHICIQLVELCVGTGEFSRVGLEPLGERLLGYLGRGCRLPHVPFG